jgi:hypothetical protein
MSECLLGNGVNVPFRIKMQIKGAAKGKPHLTLPFFYLKYGTLLFGSLFTLNCDPDKRALLCETVKLRYMFLNILQDIR